MVDGAEQVSPSFLPSSNGLLARSEVTLILLGFSMGREMGFPFSLSAYEVLDCQFLCVLVYVVEISGEQGGDQGVRQSTAPAVWVLLEHVLS